MNSHPAQDRWFTAMNEAVVALFSVVRMTPLENISLRSRPLAVIFVYILRMLFRLVISPSWRTQALNPIDATALEVYINEELLPVIRETKELYIVIRRAEEYGITPPTSNTTIGEHIGEQEDTNS
jgi:hypothetical protein